MSAIFGRSSVIGYTDDCFTTTTCPRAYDPATNMGDLVQDSFVAIDASVSVGAPGTDDRLVTLNRGRQIFVELGFEF